MGKEVGRLMGMTIIHKFSKGSRVSMGPVGLDCGPGRVEYVTEEPITRIERRDGTVLAFHGYQIRWDRTGALSPWLSGADVVAIGRVPSGWEAR